MLKSALDNINEVTCPAVKNGSVTVSVTLNAKADAVVIGVGAGTGLNIAFECKNSQPQP